MDKKTFFSQIDFNKRWGEDEWETYFQAQDAYRVSLKSDEIRKKPLSKIKFLGTDEVAAFEPVVQEYSLNTEPSVMSQIHISPFHGDSHPEEDYHPGADEDPHYWGEGSPLASSLIYRDCCRFAICTSLELDRYLKRRDPAFRKEHSAEFESLRFHANWVAINIADGHKIGYSSDRICGNIAKSRRALKHTETCISLLSRVSLKTRSARLRRELFSFAVQLRNALYTWIDELRLRRRA